MTTGRPCAFLDRDGVLIAACERDGRPQPPATRADAKVLPGVVQACNQLHEHGLLLILATNQPDIARGTASRQDVEDITDMVTTELRIDHEVYVKYNLRIFSKFD